MRKNKYIIVLAAALLTTLTGCSDFLDAENKSGVDADPYFSTSEGQVALRATVYNDLKPLVNDVNMTEWGTDVYTITQTARANDYQTYKLTAEDAGVESYYKNCYSLINMANGLLKYAAENPKYVAEAKFLRSFGYYNLIQQFGAVPYVTTYIEDGTREYPRTPLNEIYPAIITELESIMNDSNLPETDLNGNVSRRAVKALLAKVCLAAGWDLETTLNDATAGTYTVNSTNYFQKAAQYADEVIGGQQLTMSFADKWSPSNEQNDEVIWAVQYDRAGYPGDALSGGHGRQNTYGSQLGDPISSGQKTCSGVLVPNEKGIYLWAKGDERLDATFMMTLYNYFPTISWPLSGYYAYYNASDESKESLGIMTKFFPWYTSNREIALYINNHRSLFTRGTATNDCSVHKIAATSTIWEFNADGSTKATTSKDYASFISQYVAPTLVCKKFDDPNTVQQAVSTNDYRDIVVFHVSEMYLTAAEAYLMAGNEQKALDYVNVVRDRAKATHLSSFSAYEPDYEVNVSFGSIRPIDVILDERARELWAETTRWVDLRRTRQLVKYNIQFNSEISTADDMSNVRGEVKWYKPIPSSEIATNTAISDDDQNPGY